MTEQQCMDYLNQLNHNENIFKICITPQLDIILEKYDLGIEQPTKYKRYFAIKHGGKYVGLFFENLYNDTQENLQFFIDKNLRGQINYYPLFDDYIFPILFHKYEKIKVSFKNSKIKDKISKINVLIPVTQLKGNKITLIKKNISKDLLINKFSIYPKDDKELKIFINEYKDLYIKLQPQLKNRFNLKNIIKDENFSSVNGRYIKYYFQPNENNDNIIKELKKIIELYFIIEHYYQLLYKNYNIELNKI